MKSFPNRNKQVYTCIIIEKPETDEYNVNIKLKNDRLNVCISTGTENGEHEQHSC